MGGECSKGDVWQWRRVWHDHAVLSPVTLDLILGFISFCKFAAINVEFLRGGRAFCGESSTRVALGIGLLSGRMQLGGQGGCSFAAYHSPYAPRVCPSQDIQLVAHFAVRRRIEFRGARAGAGEVARTGCLGGFRVASHCRSPRLTTLPLPQAHISASMSQYTLPGEGVNSRSLTLKFCTKATHLLPVSKGTASYFELVSLMDLRWQAWLGHQTNIRCGREDDDPLITPNPPSVEGDAGIGNGVECLTRMARMDVHEHDFVSPKGTNGRMTPPVCAADENLWGGEIMIV
ncbi:hypothetical protein IW261DRAFT_1672186 [Armillaria novae-zelandiae]|uniref:Uncharacterized protein n=1 Tax=Armillaria novae-zelandiae TaxID=153914 RepID=A0AA39T837_9AGAR|nr:hypothetical protein IW261DRAFT_1672186 [Armillaria novae-zelandiae]